MAHELECKNGVWSFVYSAQEGAGWHGLGAECPDSADNAQWRRQAGHDFTVSKRQISFASPSGSDIFPDRFAMVRDDNSHPLGIASDVYKIVQPAQVDDLCDSFASYDAKLGRSSAFTLRQGDLICSAYAYRDSVTIGGDVHKAYLMGSTSFDGSSATRFWISVVRAVCANTIAAGLGESKAIVTVRHNGRLVPHRVQEQLATLASQVERYKALGDMLASTVMSQEQISTFFKQALDIPLDAKRDDIGTRKLNQFSDLSRAFSRTKQERGGSYDAFSALQALTRYVDHDRSVRNSAAGDEKVARFDSANFGSGAALKIRAANLLAAFAAEKVTA